MPCATAPFAQLAVCNCPASPVRLTLILLGITVFYIISYTINFSLWGLGCSLLTKKPLKPQELACACRRLGYRLGPPVMLSCGVGSLKWWIDY